MNTEKATMLNYEQMRSLIELADKDAIMREVKKLSEEDAKLALVMVLVAWRTGNEINEKIDANLRRRIAELGAQ